MEPLYVFPRSKSPKVQYTRQHAIERVVRELGSELNSPVGIILMENVVSYIRRATVGVGTTPAEFPDNIVIERVA